MDNSPCTTRSTKLSIEQKIDSLLTNRGVSSFFPQMKIHVLRKAYEAMEPLTFHRVISLIRTDQDHEQKTCASSFKCTFTVAVSTVKGFLVLLKISLFISLAQRCPLKRPNPQQTIFCVSGAGFIFGFKLIKISRQIPRCFAVTICMS